MGRDRAPVLLGEREYRWEELELTEAPDQGWAHHGVAVLDDGSVVAAAPDRACLVRLDVSGRELSRMDLELVEMHGITVSSDARAERLWVADNGHKFVPGQPGYGEVNRPGRVVAIELDGSMHQEIAAPDMAAYERDPWQPCAVAVDDEALGGTGDLWVADGYGQSLDVYKRQLVNPSHKDPLLQSNLRTASQVCASAQQGNRQLQSTLRGG